MKNPIWSAIAAVVSHPAVASWLIRRAHRTPYANIMSPDGSETYMVRGWVFNPYPASGAPKRKGWNWLPSVRVHRIMCADRDRHCHDHPWDARTIILRGWYRERRLFFYSDTNTPTSVGFFRTRGDTATLKFGEYHRIEQVSPDGVWTLFITWKYRGMWGFNVDGVKVPWRQYLGLGDPE